MFPSCFRNDYPPIAVVMKGRHIRLLDDVLDVVSTPTGLLLSGANLMRRYSTFGPSTSTSTNSASMKEGV